MVESIQHKAIVQCIKDKYGGKLEGRCNGFCDLSHPSGNIEVEFGGRDRIIYSAFKLFTSSGKSWLVVPKKRLKLAKEICQHFPSVHVVTPEEICDNWKDYL